MKLHYSKVVRSCIFIILWLTILMLIQPIAALEYYADITIDIEDSGFVTIEGATNSPDLLVIDSQNYTSKIQRDWFLNITREEIFSEYIFSVQFPPGASVYQVDSSGTVWIEEESKRLVIHGFGEDTPLSLQVIYQLTQISDTDKTPSTVDAINIVLFIGIIILVILISISLYRSHQKKQVNDSITSTRMKGLTERQQKIIDLLLQHDGPLTQTAIEKELEMPKAAVSRNIHSLERKGLIEIEKVGMSHRISVKKL